MPGYASLACPQTLRAERFGVRVAAVVSRIVSESEAASRRLREAAAALASLSVQVSSCLVGSRPYQPRCLSPRRPIQLHMQFSRVCPEMCEIRPRLS